MSVSLKSLNTQSSINPDTIKRAKEGLRDAQNPVIKQAIREGLNDLETIAEGKLQRPINGYLRRFLLGNL